MVNKNPKVAQNKNLEILISIKKVDYVPKSVQSDIGIKIDNIQLLKHILDVVFT